jgi:zinc protease
MMRGTKKHTRQQIQDELDKLKAQVRAGTDLGRLSISLQCKRENLVPVLKLLGEILREPTFPSEELDVLKRQTKQDLESGRTDPQVLAFEMVRRKLNPYPKDDVRYVPTIDEEIARVDAVTADQVRNAYAEQLGGSVGEFVAIGDVDQAATRAAVEEILSGWKTSVPYRRITQTAHTEVPGSRQDILTPDKENAVYIAAHAVAMTDSDPDYPAMEVANFILGGSGLASRLPARVRQKEGLSYGAGSGFNAHMVDKYGRVLLFAICNPQNIDKVDKAMGEELNRFIEKGVNETELAEAKKAFLQQLQVQRSRDAQLMSTLGSYMFVGRTLQFDADAEKKIADSTVEQVNDAIRRHWNPSRLIIVRGGDFNKKTAERTK